VFCRGSGIETCALTPEELAARLPEGAVVAGDGAIRYRDRLPGVRVPNDVSPLHVPWARHHATLRELWGGADPQYVRAPDADRVLTARAAS
jgi:hypothetical protein